MRAILHSFFLAMALILLVHVQAQDVHFSQPLANPLFLNSAMGGNYYGDWRAGASVREQWRSIEKPYQSYSAFYDRKVHYYSKEINAGLLFIHDQSGNAKLTSEKIYLNLAYPIRKGRSLISAGIQPGIVIRSYTDDLTFPEQYDHSIGKFNRELPNNESYNYGNTQRFYFDLNMGMMWTLYLPKIRPRVGFALLHLNQPRASFNNQDDQLGIRQNIHADVRIKMKNDLYLQPAYYFNGQKKANQMLMGMDVGKRFKKNDFPVREVFAGLYFRDGYQRNTDAFTPKIGLQYEQWRFGMSYDITLSELESANANRGAFELSIIYIAPNTSPKHTAIPCERF